MCMITICKIVTSHALDPPVTNCHTFSEPPKANSLCIYTFAPASLLLTNRLTHAHNICINCSDNFSWSSKHIFNFLRFVIQKLRVFKERTERYSVRVEKSKYKATCRVKSLRVILTKLRLRVIYA